MCGLTGILHSMPSDDTTRNIIKMTSFLVHRGPNSEGYWSEGNIGFGHRRLAVIDLSKAGIQPMISNCGRYVLVYNGEIYNHLELRYELEKEGAASNWRGHSDTETLLAAIVHWGIDDALRRSRGMFALALWDKQKKRLNLARDRMGEKPLYWGWAGKDLIFGSELKALRAHPDFPSEVCHKALNQYLRFMYIPAPRSINPNIYKLEPGTILSVDSSPPTVPPRNPIRPGGIHGSITIRRYWDLNSEIKKGANDMIEDEHEAVMKIEKILGGAVERQMISDVPLGAFLSGGVDSSTIVALMQKKSNRPIQTFTIGFDEPNYDESSYSELVAKHLGTEHNKLIVTDLDAREIIPNLPWLYDEPFADSSQIPTHLICRAARQHVTVAMSGDGGDELFGGYNRYIYGPRLLQLLKLIPFSMRRFLGLAAQKISEQSWDKLGITYNQIRSGSAGISDLGIKVHRLGERISKMENLDDLYFNMISSWIEPTKLLKNIEKEPTSQLDDKLPEFGLDNLAMQMMLQDMRSYLPDDILCKVDRAAMGVSLETRTPFLDPQVISLSSRLPMRMKIRNGQGKWALRQVLYQNIPPEIIERPKKGFTIPIGLWIRGPLSNWAKDLLSNESLIKDGIFNSDIIQHTLTEHMSGRRDWTSRLWPILMFQAWKNHQY
jgi:asparagine synthase (glutamine-hydrolysing)